MNEVDNTEEIKLLYHTLIPEKQSVRMSIIEALLLSPDIKFDDTVFIDVTITVKK